MTHVRMTIQEKPSLKFIIPFTAILTSFLCYNYAFGFYLFPMLLPEMRRDLNLAYSAVGLITAAAQMSYIAASLITSAAVAKLGPARVVVCSTATCGIALLTVGFIPSTAVLAVMLVILGAVAASVWVPMVAVVTRHIPDGHRGLILGIFSSAGAFGAILNGGIVPLVLDYAGWRGVWIASGALTSLTVLGGCIVLARLGVLAGNRWGSEKPEILKPAVLRQVANPPVVMIWIVIFLAGMVCIPYQTYLSAFLAEATPSGVSLAPKIWMVIGLSGAVGGALVGMLADQAGTTRALRLTSVLILAAACLLWLNIHPFFALISGVLYGLSYYSIFGLVPVYISKTVTRQSAIRVFGMANVMVGLGGAAGNFIGGWWQSLTAGSLSIIYIGCSIGAVLMVLAVTALPEEGRLAGTQPG